MIGASGQREFEWPADLAEVEISWSSVNSHPPASSEAWTIGQGHPKHAEAADALRQAGFPRLPVTFSLGRQHLVPGETTGTLSVRAPRGTASVTCFMNAWNEDPGYARFFEIVKPGPPWPAGGRWTLPTPATLYLDYEVGSKYAAGQYALYLRPGGKLSLLFEHQPAHPAARRRFTAAGALDAPALDDLTAQLAAIRWPREAPPFDAARAAAGHTPASLALRPGRDDEGFARIYFAWEQRLDEPRWAAVFEPLDAQIRALVPSLR